MRKRRVILLGSTGSIGTSAMKIAAAMPNRMEIVGMAAHRSAKKLAESANTLSRKLFVWWILLAWRNCGRL